MAQLNARDRIKFEHLIEFRNCLIVPGPNGHIVCHMLARHRIAGAQLHSPTALCFRTCPVPSKKDVDNGQGVVGRDNRFIQLQGLLGIHLRLGEQLIGRTRAEQPQIKIGLGKVCVRLSLGWIETDGLNEELRTLLKVHRSHLVAKEVPFEASLIGLRVDLASPGRGLQFRPH